MSTYKSLVYISNTFELFFIGGAQNVSNTSDGFYDYSGDGGEVVIKPGCNPDKQPWCNHQSRVYFFQYLIGLPTITIGFCATSILCYTILSKILGPWLQVRRQLFVFYVVN